MTPTQLGVLKGVGAGAILSCSALAVVLTLELPLVQPEEALAERLAFALRWDIGLVVCLAVAIGALARHRFFTAEDINGGGLASETPKALVLQSILQNTLEQTVLGFIAHLAWVIIMPLAWLSAIPMAVVLFVIGRVLFARGYARGAPARALGFALTFYPTVLMIVVMLIRSLS